ncbi:hypothetical protein ACA910_013037 [Epithemia clementina (nom. ined.)]
MNQNFATYRNMDRYKEARLSGLEFEDVTKWNEWEWPCLPGLCLKRRVAVVLNDEQTVFVLGGLLRHVDILLDDEFEPTRRVMIWDPSKQMKWQKGPSMIKAREDFAAVVCNGAIYVIGGMNYDQETFDTMERLDVSPEPTNTTEKNQCWWRRMTRTTAKPTTAWKKWTKLKSRLTVPSRECAAVAVQNRYIIVLGGYRTAGSVDIVDTANGHVVYPGPNMIHPRGNCGASVIGNTIYAVGGDAEGSGKTVLLRSVECLQFHDSKSNGSSSSSNDNMEEGDNNPVPHPFTNTSWTVHRKLRLSDGYWNPSVTRVGTCLVVAGGKKAEVLDTKRNKVWDLPHLAHGFHDHCSLVALSNRCLLVFGSERYPSLVQAMRFAEFSPEGFQTQMQDIDKWSPLWTSPTTTRSAEPGKKWRSKTRKGADGNTNQDTSSDALTVSIPADPWRLRLGLNFMTYVFFHLSRRHGAPSLLSRIPFDTAANMVPHNTISNVRHSG